MRLLPVLTGSTCTQPVQSTQLPGAYSAAAGTDAGGWQLHGVRCAGVNVQCSAVRNAAGMRTGSAWPPEDLHQLNCGAAAPMFHTTIRPSPEHVGSCLPSNAGPVLMTFEPCIVYCWCAQYLVGFGSYLWPTTSLEQRQALGPYHRFWGLAVYAAGMAAAAVSGCALSLAYQSKHAVRLGAHHKAVCM